MQAAGTPFGVQGSEESTGAGAGTGDVLGETDEAQGRLGFWRAWGLALRQSSGHSAGARRLQEGAPDIPRPARRPGSPRPPHAPWRPQLARALPPQPGLGTEHLHWGVGGGGSWGELRGWGVDRVLGELVPPGGREEESDHFHLRHLSQCLHGLGTAEISPKQSTYLATHICGQN